MTINRYSRRKRIYSYGEIWWIENNTAIGFECIFDSFNFNKKNKNSSIIIKMSEREKFMESDLTSKEN